MSRKNGGEKKKRRPAKMPAGTERFGEHDVLTDERERKMAASYKDGYDTWLR